METLTAAREDILNTLKELKEGQKFDFLMDICGVDYPERTERFEVVYHLLSMRMNHRIRIRIRTDEETAVPSVVPVWKEIAEAPVPVPSPAWRMSSPPVMFVPPVTVEPAATVSARPTVPEAVFSIQNFWAAALPRERMLVGLVVPMPTLPVLDILTCSVGFPPFALVVNLNAVA